MHTLPAKRKLCPQPLDTVSFTLTSDTLLKRIATAWFSLMVSDTPCGDKRSGPTPETTGFVATLQTPGASDCTSSPPISPFPSPPVVPTGEAVGNNSSIGVNLVVVACCHCGGFGAGVGKRSVSGGPDAPGVGCAVPNAEGGNPVETGVGANVAEPAAGPCSITPCN